MSQRCHAGSAAPLQNIWRLLNCSCAGFFNDNFPRPFFSLPLPRMLCIMTPVFPGTSSHRSAALYLHLPMPVLGSQVEETRGENPPSPQTHSCIMHVYICSASCAVSWFILSLSRLTPPSPRQLWRYRRWAGRRSTPWISTPVRA